MDVMPDHALMLINESAPLMICSSSIMDNLATDTKAYTHTVSSISVSSKVQGASSRSQFEL
jgi:hypothetical protein